MKVFLDTNVILDFYDSDRGHYQPAAIIFDLALKGKIELSVCALVLSMLFSCFTANMTRVCFMKRCELYINCAM